MHKEFPKSVERTEFWKQIKRTVNGKPVSDRDIRMILSQIRENMDFNSGDHLLDLGCGNAALASNFFGDIEKYTGVDFSEYLLGVAKEFFMPNKDVVYIENNVLDFVKEEENYNLYSKVLIYGVMAYFTQKEFLEIIHELSTKFTNVKKIFIGQIPDKHKASDFYYEKDNSKFILNDPKSPIGVWWCPEEFYNLCREVGYEVEIVHMPKSFYASKYRFDAVLSKR